MGTCNSELENKHKISDAKLRCVIKEQEKTIIEQERRLKATYEWQNEIHASIKITGETVNELARKMGISIEE